MILFLSGVCAGLLAAVAVISGTVLYYYLTGRLGIVVSTVEPDKREGGA